MIVCEGAKAAAPWSRRRAAEICDTFILFFLQIIVSDMYCIVLDDIDDGKKRFLSAKDDNKCSVDCSAFIDYIDLIVHELVIPSVLQDGIPIGAFLLGDELPRVQNREGEKCTIP